MVDQTITITVKLTDEELEQARALGILDADAIEQWVRERLARARDVQRMTDIMDTLQSLPDRPTPEEIDAEIQAYRVEKRAQRESCG